MTMALLVVDFATGEAYYSNAGHTPLLLVSSGEITVAQKPSSPLGLSLSFVPNVIKIMFKPGDGVFLYTDGLIDNEGPNGEKLKIRSLRDHLAANASPIVSDSLLRETCANLWKSKPQKDDSSYLHLRWLPRPQSAANQAG